jgi:peptidoglycan/LPS O-acetylase OafA/YrhL
VTASATPEGGPVARTERAFPALDGARVLAATAVLLHHVAFWTGDYTPDLVGRIFSRLDVGVAIFFVLSGFLLSRPLFLAAAQGRPAPRTAAYLWRRALRILPAYWLTVAAALLLLPQNDGSGPGTWLRHLTLTQIYGTGHLREGLSHTWSLSTEVAFYLVLPFAGAALVRLVRRWPRRPGRVLAVLGLATLLGLAWLVWNWVARPFPAAGLDLWLPSYTGWFAGGMALALLSVSDADLRPVRTAADLGASLPTCWAAAAALFWIATSPVAGPMGLLEPTATQAAIKNVLYLGVAVLLILPLVFGDQRAGWARRALSSRPGRFLGDVSYGLFLIHVVVLAGAFAVFDLVQFQGDVVWMALAVWTVSVALASVLYVGLERPIRRWRNVVPENPRPGPPVSSAAATALTASSART